ncbi:hypothetical protein [Shouchella patagoniensis]|uniref:hypothetical protein n=1 Tax=Shouchella patagoniensis TaxID=228576 RepID=UPI000995D2F2|nr:hypothetical protein [Shouchella patagoniensis]
MISAQTFRVIASFHGAVWVLFFIGAAVWLIYSWRGLSTGRLLIAAFVRLSQVILVMTGIIVLYAYQFMAYYTIKGIIALLMFFFYERVRVALKRRQHYLLFPYGTLLLFTAVVVWLMGINGR